VEGDDSMINPKMTPIAQLGDLVNIAGYANRLFRVDSYTHEFTFERGIEAEEIYYDCSCVTAGEYTLGAQEDVTVVCREGQTEEFLKTYQHPEVDEIATRLYDEVFGNIFGGEAETVMQPIKTIVTKKAKEPTKQERIDALLDDMNNVNTAIELIGDEDGGYAKRLGEIKAELTVITEGGE